MPYQELGDHLTTVWDKIAAAYPPPTVVSRRLEGDDELGCCMVGDELGFSFRPGRLLGKVFSKKNLRFVTKVAKIAGGVVAVIVPPAGAAIVAGAIAADKTLAAVHAAGDIGKAAKATIDATKKLADAGDPSAQRGLKLLEDTAKLRKEKGIKPGQVMPVAAKHLEQAKLAANILRPVAPRATALAAAQLVGAAQSTNAKDRATARKVYTDTQAKAAKGDAKAKLQLAALNAAAKGYRKAKGDAACPPTVVFLVDVKGNVQKKIGA